MLTTLVEQSGVDFESISEVELIGGSSRIPFLKVMVANFFKQEPKTTMNQDEAVVRGAGMQCAILSPNCKVKEFSVCETPREAFHEEEAQLFINLDDCIKIEVR